MLMVVLNFVVVCFMIWLLSFSKNSLVRKGNNFLLIWLQEVNIIILSDCIVWAFTAWWHAVVKNLNCRVGWELVKAFFNTCHVACFSNITLVLFVPVKLLNSHLGFRLEESFDFIFVYNLLISKSSEEITVVLFAVFAFSFWDNCFIFIVALNFKQSQTFKLGVSTRWNLSLNCFYSNCASTVFKAKSELILTGQCRYHAVFVSAKFITLCVSVVNNLLFVWIHDFLFILFRFSANRRIWNILIVSFSSPVIPVSIQNLRCLFFFLFFTINNRRFFQLLGSWLVFRSKLRSSCLSSNSFFFFDCVVVEVAVASLLEAEISDFPCSYFLKGTHAILSALRVTSLIKIVSTRSCLLNIISVSFFLNRLSFHFHLELLHKELRFFIFIR